MFEHALSTLRRAAEHGYPWSIYPAEATALVAEVERLRAELKAERAAVVAWLEARAFDFHGCDGVTEHALLAVISEVERGEHRREEEP